MNAMQTTYSAIGPLTVALVVVLVWPADVVTGELVISVFELGENVVAIGSGTANIEELTGDGGGQLCCNGGGTLPRNGYFTMGRAAPEWFLGLTGPSDLGWGGEQGVFGSDTYIGDQFGIGFLGAGLVLPVGYQSGEPLSGKSVWNNNSLATLGLKRGHYVWTWGRGINADSLTIIIGAVPILQAPLPRVEFDRGNLVVFWSSVLGQRYQIQKSTDLRTWDDRGLQVVGDGRRMSYGELQKDSVGFFRIVVE